MSEEKDRVDGTADETKAETKSSDHHTEDTYYSLFLYPLTAPTITPFVKYFCNRGYTSRIGTMEIMITAYL